MHFLDIGWLSLFMRCLLYMSNRRQGQPRAADNALFRFAESCARQFNGFARDIASLELSPMIYLAIAVAFHFDIPLGGTRDNSRDRSRRNDIENGKVCRCWSIPLFFRHIAIRGNLFISIGHNLYGTLTW